MMSLTRSFPLHSCPLLLEVQSMEQPLTLDRSKGSIERVELTPALFNTNPFLTYRADVDGLRAIAVLAVLGYHAFPEYFPGGFVGVDVFFVISGFLISEILLKQLRIGAFTFQSFYVRRIKRLFPALSIVLIACLTFGTFALLPDELQALGRDIAAASVSVSNFVLWRESGYFDREAVLKPLLHMWSLGVEEQFYFTWPAMLIFLYRRRISIPGLLMVFAAVSFAANVWLAAVRPTANFYLPMGRFWELGLGCLLAAVRDSSRWRQFQSDQPSVPMWPRSLWFRFRGLLPYIGFALILAAMLGFDDRMSFPSWAALVPTLGAMCLLSASTRSWFSRHVMAQPVLVFIGLISYPLYLWHWPLLSFATIVEGDTPAISVRGAALIASLMLAWLTYRFIERPTRARRGMRVVVVLLGILAALGAMGVLTYVKAGFPYRFDADTRAMRPHPRFDSVCNGMVPSSKLFNYCKTTQSDVPRVLFTGDSRTQAVYDGAVALLGDRYPMMLLARGGCPPLLDVDATDTDKHQDCGESRAAFLEYARHVKPSAVVLVGGGSYYLEHPNVKLNLSGIDSVDKQTAFKRGLERLIMELQAFTNVIYLSEIPGFPSAPSCFLRPLDVPWKQCSPVISRDALLADRSAYNRIVAEVAREFPRMRVIDSVAALCDQNNCSQIHDSGDILYSDAIHLSPAGGKRLVQQSGLAISIRDAMR